MDTQHSQRRVQAFLRRYDLLAKAVGPLKAPQPNEISREVAGLLLLSAKQCCIAASIIDTAENVAITTPAPVVRIRQLAHATNRRGNLVVVHGTGEETFPFPDVNTLVLNALTRLSGGGKNKRSATGESDQLVSASESEHITYIIAAMELDAIVRVPLDEGIDAAEKGINTPDKDLLFGHTTRPQVCFLRDAERLVEQVPTKDGTYIIEFEVGPEDFLPDVLIERADGFLDRAEQILSAAEALWPSAQPPVGSAVELPEEEKRYSTCAS